MILYPDQLNLRTSIYEAWQASRNVLAVSPTGAGKTVIVADILANHRQPSCAIAHRQELVFQISLALARNSVRHRIIGPLSVVKLAVQLHMAELGRSFYDSNAPCGVAGVDTLVRRMTKFNGWADKVTLWVQDEGHHLLKSNKWGRATTMFPNAYGLGVTATPLRADGKGLGRHADGLFDSMVVGLGMRALINLGRLTDYRVFAPPSDLNLSDVNITSGGDYSPLKLKTAVQRSHVVGDVVEHYQRIAPGKLGITFTPDVETAGIVSTQFNAAGIPSEVISHNTPDHIRTSILQKFKNREVLQLINVDLFGEGFDLPALEVVSMARPTQSFGLYSQQFGRALRVMEGKDRAIIIDHVGNVVRHGLPDAEKEWTLDRRDSRAKAKPSGEVPVRSCPKCTRVYERTYTACPYCGFKAQPEGRSKPEYVDGDLHELDPETLETMRNAVSRVDMDPELIRAELAAKFAPKIGQLAHVKRHVGRQTAQGFLRESIAWWAGYERALGRSNSEIYRRFYFTFGVDILGAQALNTKDAEVLTIQINEKLGGNYA